MKVLNIHKRIVSQPKNKVANVLATLSTENDRIWPIEKWPPMLFKQGIKVGAQGGHGPIKYEVELYDPQEIIQFRFSKPNGFHGIHKFEIQTLTKTTTEIKHTIDMQTTGKGTLLWLLGIRSLHNALVEDGFDKLENIFQKPQKITKWNFWVRFLRKLLARRSK